MVEDVAPNGVVEEVAPNGSAEVPLLPKAFVPVVLVPKVDVLAPPNDDVPKGLGLVVVVVAPPNGLDLLSTAPPNGFDLLSTAPPNGLGLPAIDVNPVEPKPVPEDAGAAILLDPKPEEAGAPAVFPKLEAPNPVDPRPALPKAPPVLTGADATLPKELEPNAEVRAGFPKLEVPNPARGVDPKPLLPNPGALLARAPKAPDWAPKAPD